MQFPKKHFIKMILITLLTALYISPALAGDPTNMADAMKDAGFKFETAHWISDTTMDDGSGKIKKSTNKYWISGRQSRIEMMDKDSGETQIIIDDGKQQFFYNPKQKAAMVMNSMVKSMYSGLMSSESFKQAAENRKNAKTVGSETINGKPCTIKEYQNTISNIVSQVREWVWDGKEFPMKSVVTIPGQTMNMMGQSIKMPGSKTESVVTEVTLDQPVDPSLFKLPAGVTLQTMGETMTPPPMENPEDEEPAEEE